MNTQLESNLYDRCLEHLIAVRELDFVVPKSLPIPYFGDLKRYLKSPLRVLTAALNPSNREFPADDPRFDVLKGLRGPAELELELSNYFYRNPYRAWFSAFEPVLNGLEASFGGQMATQEYPSTALHVDMCSPIATAPTWSKLSATQRAKLTITGREIFESLVDGLKPHVIVASLGWSHLQQWNDDFRAGRSWEPLLEHPTTAKGVPLRANLVVQVRAMSSRNGHSFIFVNASAADKPFGRFTTGRKYEAGQKLLERLPRVQ